jgi:hypothetical protein
MRTTVYIPDDLHEKAQAVTGERKTSRLVQLGLRRLVDENRKPPAYVTPRNFVSTLRVQQLRDRLAAQAREDYELGYQVGLQTAGEMPFSAMDDLAASDFDLSPWLARHRQEAKREVAAAGVALQPPYYVVPQNPIPVATSTRWLWTAARALGTLALRTDSEANDFTPTQPRQRGFVDALRDVWAAIESPGLNEADTGDDSDANERGGENADEDE